MDSYLKGNYMPSNQPLDAEFYSKLKMFPGYNTIGVKKEMKHLNSMLHTDENVLAIASGFTGNNTCLIACTDLRIIFIDCGMLYGVKHSEIMLNKVNAISFKNGINTGEIHIEDGATTKIIKSVQKTSTKPFVDAVYKAMEMSQSKTVSASTSFGSFSQATTSVADEIMKFKQLLDAGAITQEEYEQQKKKLLGM